MTSVTTAGGAIRAIDRLLLWIAGAALVAMMLHITADVVATNLFGSPLPLTNATVTQYYMICVAYLPLAAAELRGSHVSVDFFVNRMPPRPRAAVAVAVQLLGTGIYGALAVQAWQLATEKLARNAFLMEQTTRVTTWPSYFVIPAGFGLIAALLALRLAFALAGRPDPAPPAPGPGELGHD
jgi:TRAP-type C4-dicarboxylate transport system permease small subunit